MRCFSAIIAICAIQASSQEYYNDQVATEPSLRMGEIATANSDDLVEAILAIQAPKYGISAEAHDNCSRYLSTVMQMFDKADELIQDERTFTEGKYLMEEAKAKFLEVTNYIQDERVLFEETDMLRKKYSDHDLDRAYLNDQRALDLERKIYETMITFPECLGLIFQECLDAINSQIADIGLSTIEVVVHEKRNPDQEGYNKVVIVTNELADRVVGRTGDGIVKYPYLWNDSVSGQRVLGDAGTWNCVGDSPEDCCEKIKQSAPNPDEKGNYVECHMFIPYGGIGKPRRSDRVFINLSPDGRVHEPPIIQ